MFGAFGGLLGQSTEKKRQQQLIYQVKKQDKTESELEFISKYIESACKSNQIEQIKGTLEKEEYNQILKLFKAADLKQGEEVPSESTQFTQLSLTIVISGSIELREFTEEKSETIKKYEVGDVIFLNEENKGQIISDTNYQFMGVNNETNQILNMLNLIEFFNIFNFKRILKLGLIDFYQFNQKRLEVVSHKLVSPENSSVIYIQRSFLTKILEVSNERFEKEFKTKINCLKAVFPNIAKSDQGTQRQKSKNFKLYAQNTQGTVLTTTTSGSNDIFVVSKGKILVWVPKSKINQDYPEGNILQTIWMIKNVSIIKKKEFILLGSLQENSIFNESYVLFSKDCIYGTMMIGEGVNEVFQISKENIGSVCDSTTQDYLKANSEIRDRMYKNHMKRYSGQSVDEILKKQKEFCSKIGLNFDKIKELFKKSTKEKKIVTHNLINKNEFNKNLENFNKIMKNSTFKTTELQGDKEDIASTVTPRLVSRGNGLNQMTPAQQLSLIALRSSGKGLREGTRDINQKISDVDFDKVEQEKKNLQSMTVGGILVKKNIQQLDCSSKSELNKNESSQINKSNEKKEEQQISEEKNETTQPIQQTVDTGIKKSLHQKLEVSNTSLLQKLGQFDSVKSTQNDKDSQKQNTQQSNDEGLKNQGFIKMSEFSLKTTNKDKPFNSVFLNIAKQEINQVDKPKVEDKFAQQRKKLLNFGI